MGVLSLRLVAAGHGGGGGHGTPLGASVAGGVTSTKPTQPHPPPPLPPSNKSRPTPSQALFASASTLSLPPPPSSSSSSFHATSVPRISTFSPLTSGLTSDTSSSSSSLPTFLFGSASSSGAGLSKGSKIGIAVAASLVGVFVAIAVLLLVYRRKWNNQRRTGRRRKGAEDDYDVGTGTAGTGKSLFSSTHSRAHLITSAIGLGSWNKDPHTGTKSSFLETPSTAGALSSFVHQQQPLDNISLEPDSICESPRNVSTFDSRSKPRKFFSRPTINNSKQDGEQQQDPNSYYEQVQLRDLAPPTPIRLLDVPGRNGALQQQQKHHQQQSHEHPKEESTASPANNRRILWPHGVDSYPSKKRDSRVRFEELDL